MKTYKLVPTNPNHRDWALSSYCGVVEIQACDEDHARDLATSEFGQAARVERGGATRNNPWQQSDIVACYQV